MPAAKRIQMLGIDRKIAVRASEAPSGVVSGAETPIFGRLSQEVRPKTPHVSALQRPISPRLSVHHGSRHCNRHCGSGFVRKLVIVSVDGADMAAPERMTFIGNTGRAPTLSSAWTGAFIGLDQATLVARSASAPPGADPTRGVRDPVPPGGRPSDRRPALCGPGHRPAPRATPARRPCRPAPVRASQGTG